MQKSASATATVLEASCSGFSFADPVFVLCNGRSGSTLLRFLLDAHPELACPPETNLPALCAQLATVWSLIEGAPLSPNRGDEPPEIPDAAIAGIRATMDRMVGSYLERRGKKRYCDKSLGTARFADLLLRVYPEARFICLYRHPMDVIASGMEACPWGLNGYGFDPYIATTPGNAVLALARFWADNAAITVAAEEEFADRCLRVRYEDLVTDPEGTAEGIFSFLEAAPAPGISESCFSSERERFGPADYKIWCTSKISSDSVGRGWSIPTGLIPPPVLGAINELTGKLGYLPVDAGWGTSAPPTDLRVPVIASDDADVELQAPEQDAGTARVKPPAQDSATAEGVAAADGGQLEPVSSQLLGSRLRTGLEDVRPDVTGRWKQWGGEKFVAIWVPEDPREPAEHWLVRLNERTVSFVNRAAQEDSDWDIIGSAGAWEQVISGKLNLSVALRACQLRYCDGDESGPLAADTRIRVLADLMTLTNWRAGHADD
jgi:Sulfotransferase family